MAHAQAVDDIRRQLPSHLSSPRVAIVCGSGLATLSSLLSEITFVQYSTITGFVASTVPGHQSQLVFGLLGKTNTPVVCQLGRFHAYEGFPMTTVIFPMRVFSLLGVESVIITNAAGGLDPTMQVGTIVAIQDHLSLPSLTSWNPLIGENDSTFGTRFPPMSDAYDFDLRKTAFRAAHALEFEKGMLREGVYAWVAGPTYETRAEQKFLVNAGATVVGMSTVPEVIAARHAGIRVLVLSLCTNIVVATPYRSAEAEVIAERSGLASLLKRDELSTAIEKLQKGGATKDQDGVASHEEVLETSKQKSEEVRRLVERIVDDLYT